MKSARRGVPNQFLPADRVEGQISRPPFLSGAGIRVDVDVRNGPDRPDKSSPAPCFRKKDSQFQYRTGVLAFASYAASDEEPRGAQIDPCNKLVTHSDRQMLIGVPSIGSVLPMSNQQEFLSYAEQCDCMAEGGAAAGQCEALKKMSRAWTRLAAEEERIAELIRDVDKYFTEPVDSWKGRLRMAPEAPPRIQ